MVPDAEILKMLKRNIIIGFDLNPLSCLSYIPNVIMFSYMVQDPSSLILQE